MRFSIVLRALPGVVVAGRVAKGAWRQPPLTAHLDSRLSATVSVVVPARDEERRIGPCLAGLKVQGELHEVIVVDDQSTDDTAAVAAAAGAKVVTGAVLPPGWVGKAWALQQGLEAATGEWLVTLDADTEPQPGMVAALVKAADDGGYDLLSAGARFVCDTPGQRWLHPAMLTTLVYRFGPPGGRRPSPSARTMANGQCMCLRRNALMAAGGWTSTAGHLTDDIALARRLAGEGWRIGFVDGTSVVQVRMHTSMREVWREWGRSLPMADVTTLAWKVADLGLLWMTLGLPPLRLLTGRADRLDAALGALRLGVVAATAGAYQPRGAAYWSSPLADLAAVVRLTEATLRPTRRWRGRSYDGLGGSAGR